MGRIENLNMFIGDVKSKIGCGYVYGSQGEILTDSMLKRLIYVLGKGHYYFDGYSAEKWIGEQCFDCSGLIVWALQKQGLINEDYSASMLYNQLCNHVRKEDLEDGDLLFKRNSKGSISHVGIFIGGKTLHAKGTYHGVVLNDDLDEFTLYGRLTFFSHWALRDALYLRGQGVEIYDLDFDKPVTKGEAIAMNARVFRKINMKFDK